MSPYSGGLNFQDLFTTSIADSSMLTKWKEVSLSSERVSVDSWSLHAWLDKASLNQRQAPPLLEGPCLGSEAHRASPLPGGRNRANGFEFRPRGHCQGYGFPSKCYHRLRETPECSPESDRVIPERTLHRHGASLHQVRPNP